MRGPGASAIALLLVACACLVAPAVGQATWSPCNLFSTGASSSLTAECSIFVVPGEYNTGEGSINVFVKRALGSNNPGRSKQLWLVSDGPGLSGEQYEGQVEALMAATGNVYDIYLMDHRGTGRSSPIDCPVDAYTGVEDPAGVCVDYLDETFGREIRYYETSNVAQDYVRIVSIVLEDEILQYGEDPVVAFYGGGYGAYVINQVLAISPSLANGVVLDSYMYPSLQEADLDANDIGLEFVEGCMQDEECRNALQGADARSLVESLFDNFDDLSCPHLLGLEKQDYQAILRRFLEDKELRNLILPVVVRTARCNSDDFDFLLTGLPGDFLDPYYPNQDADNRVTGESYVFRNQVDLNEFLLFEDTTGPASREQLDNISDNLEFSDFQPGFLSDLWEAWRWRQTNTIDPYLFSASNVPMLLLSAEFDSVTHPRYTDLAADEYDNQLQRHIEVPFSIHNVFLNADTETGGSCGFDIIVDFLNTGSDDGDFDPRGLSRLCLADLVRPDYGVEEVSTQDLSEQIFGDRNAFGDGPVPNLNDDDDDGSSGSSRSSNSPASSGIFDFSTATFSYFTFAFSPSNLPDLPDLSLSTIVVIDTVERSSLEPSDSLGFVINTGVLPPTSMFGPDGTFLGAASCLQPVTAVLVFCSLAVLLL
mmetsp:Transcript_12804/g.51093  ORF Transcript_12804/g.51093 Transcript_12804/m.51093 type:complete len:651 (-) Transcript_12804:102-2054(-)